MVVKKLVLFISLTPIAKKAINNAAAIPPIIEPIDIYVSYFNVTNPVPASITIKKIISFQFAVNFS